MEFWEILTIAVGLSMDAFAVSVCKGLSVEKVKAKHLWIAGAYFGGFQALMPLIGYFLGTSFRSLIESVDHWIAFGLLVFIGGNMIWESRGRGEETMDASFSVKAMLPLAVATSIDALTVGITFAFLNVNLILAITLIGIITFVLSVIGTKIGNRFGDAYERNAELVGGCILILLGLKILLEHLNIINF